MRACLIIFFCALIGCTAPPGNDVGTFRAAPERLGLLVIDVEATGLTGWAIVLEDGQSGREITFRPQPQGIENEPSAYARAVPPGDYRPVRVMAVQDGQRCEGEEAPTTRAIYPASLDGDHASVSLNAGQALYLGHIMLSAKLLDCEGPSIQLEQTAGNPDAATTRMGYPLIQSAPLLPLGQRDLRPR
jgi:hypothetical protein